MEGKEVPNDFFIWGIDDSPYGPVELPVLIDWISDERVLADTWVFARRDGSWRRAAEIPGLKHILVRPSSRIPPRLRVRASLPARCGASKSCPN